MSAFFRNINAEPLRTNERRKRYYELMNICSGDSAATNISPLEAPDHDAENLLSIPCDVVFKTNCRIIHVSQVAYRSGYSIRIYGRFGRRVRICIGHGLFLARKRRVCLSLLQKSEGEYLNTDERNCC